VHNHREAVAELAGARRIGGSPVLGGREVVRGADRAAEVSRIGEPPASGDRAHRPVRQRRISQILATPLQSALADPARHRCVLALEQLVEIPKRDVVSGGNHARGKPGPRIVSSCLKRSGPRFALSWPAGEPGVLRRAVAGPCVHWWATTVRPATSHHAPHAATLVAMREARATTQHRRCSAPGSD
jgi:hypothetical protein